MDSGSSLPGCPGFMIHPLKSLDKIPSGRRQMWLTKYDSKHHLNLNKLNKNSKNNTMTNIQYYGLCVTCVYIIRSVLGVVSRVPNDPHTFLI